MKKSSLVYAALTLTLLTAVAHLAACAGPGYYAQAVSGHLRLVNKRQEITAILSDENAEPGLVQDLGLAMEIREFAIAELGLPANDSYTSFVRTGREAVTWNVIAAPELSLEPRRWCFLVAGCVPYRGYFQRQAALDFAARMASKGYDVTVSPASAYSTLGWLEDPLLDTMLHSGEEQLAAALFHELAHQQLYVSSDTVFSESYASFVEDLGVTLWLQRSGRAHRLPEWQRRQRAAREFDALLERSRDQLYSLYASAAADSEKRRSKMALFTQLEEDYRGLVSGPWHGRDFFAGWFSEDVNNARLALLNSYRGGVCAFAELYRSTGGQIQRFHAEAARRAELDTGARRAWMDQPCPVVASPPEL
jgi:predicted aminopeptidase